jgi:hypothetical protein
MSHRSALISLLCWVCLFLGFHTLGLYAHNDAVTAFGSPSKQILIQPLAHYVPDLFRSYTPGFSSARPLSPSDVLAAHALSLASHTTVLIVAKGLLDSRGSSIIPDKHLLDFSFPCDGPGRGGTCDSSSWDSFYLAFFGYSILFRGFYLYFIGVNSLFGPALLLLFPIALRILLASFAIIFGSTLHLSSAVTPLSVHHHSLSSPGSFSLLILSGLLASCFLFLGVAIGRNLLIPFFFCI